MSAVGEKAKLRASVGVAEPVRSDPGASATRGPQDAQTAAYIADMCKDLSVLARKGNLAFLAHLLAMAQAEANLRAEPQEQGRANRKTI